MDISGLSFMNQKNDIYLEIGFAYTKIGFVNESSLRKIIQTPKQIYRPLYDLQKEKVLLIDCLRTEDNFEEQIERFLYDIFFIELHINASERNIFLVVNFLIPIDFCEKIVKVLFKYNFPSIYILNSNCLPLYLTGQFSGIVVDSGFFETQIVAFDYGIPTNFQVSEAAGHLVNKNLKKLILDENSSSVKKILDNQLIENLKFKYIFLPLKKQYKSYFSDSENIEKMKHAQIKYQIGSKTNIKLSYFTKISSTSCLFGDVELEEPNIANSLLLCISKIDILIRKKLCQNIILTGGNVQIPGFARRLREEIIDLLNTENFQELKSIENYISFTDVLYPGNTVNFISASIISKLSGIESFQIQKQQFHDLGDQFPDYISKSFIYNN